jgi:DNA polymerase III delta prime subunit
MGSPLPGKTAPRLFISYSHDSREHEDRVRALADRLRQNGIDAAIDQYDMAPPTGWPMWMDGEIQKADFVALICTETYLKRVEGRESPGKGRGVLWESRLIYNLLYLEDTPIQRFIPILPKGGMSASIPLPIRGLTYYQVDTEEGYEDFYRHLTAQPRHEKPALGKLKSLPVIEPQSYPASLEIPTEQKAPTSLDKRNRLQMLKRVRLDWIDGVLKQSLYQVVRIELGLKTKSDAVEQPLKAIVQTPDQPSRVIQVGTAISQTFDDHGSALLILGAPGTGKTTLLLELAEQLINRAEQDESHPIPVIFNLSSWAVRRPSLREWLISELNERSDVPKKVAQQWVETEQIIPLLDGLDEVSVEHRQACAEAINDFRRDHGLLAMAVCSRIADYEALGMKLRLRSAVVAQPLTKPEVQDYLERIGEPLLGLRAALENEPSFWELIETPLMLWVAMLAYRDSTVEFVVTDTVEGRRTQLFANFVDTMFKRRSVAARYSSKRTLTWLCWLASALEHNNQTVFYLETFGEDWLPTLLQRWFLRTGVIAAIWLASYVIFALIDALDIGLAVGLTMGSYAASLKHQPNDMRRIILINNSVGMSEGMIFAVIGGLIVGLVVWFAGGLIFGLISGLIFGLIMLMGIALTRDPSSEMETHIKPNQGTHTSIKTALACGLAFGLFSYLIIGPIFELIFPIRRPNFELIAGLIPGVIVFLTTGGIFSLRHLFIRLMLWRNSSMPLRCVRFLDHSVERLFLRKVGGGYIFIHRMVLEYFAFLHEQA